MIAGRLPVLQAFTYDVNVTFIVVYAYTLFRV